MRRAMARQAEAERERRAKVVAAEGEYQQQRSSRPCRGDRQCPGRHAAQQLQTMVEGIRRRRTHAHLPDPDRTDELGAKDHAILGRQRAIAKLIAGEATSQTGSNTLKRFRNDISVKKTERELRNPTSSHSDRGFGYLIDRCFRKAVEPNPNIPHLKIELRTIQDVA